MSKRFYTYLLEIQKRLEKVFPFPGWGRVEHIDEATFDEHNFYVADNVAIESSKKIGQMTAYLYSKQYAATPQMPFHHWFCHVIIFYDKELITDDKLWAIQRNLRHWGRNQVKPSEDHSIIGVVITDSGFLESSIEIIFRAFYVEEVNQGIMGQYLVGVDLNKNEVYTPRYGIAPKLGKHAEEGLRSFFNPRGIFT
ncbi:MAG: hypothetical protein ACP6IU_01135 [Candidatus Asgardarchaeia archaeon]